MIPEPYSIRSEEELDRAIAMMNELIDREDLGPDEDDYLNVLSDLVARYEAEAHPIPPPDSDGDMLRFLLEMKGITQSKLSADVAIPESTISEVLSGKRKLNRRHIGLLARYFRVSPGVFFRE